MNSGRPLIYFVFCLATFVAHAGAPGGPEDTRYMSVEDIDELPVSDFSVRRASYSVKGLDHYYNLLRNPQTIKWNEPAVASVYRYEQSFADGTKLVATQGFQTGLYVAPAMAAILDNQNNLNRDLNGLSVLTTLEQRYKKQNQSCCALWCCWR